MHPIPSSSPEEKMAEPRRELQWELAKAVKLFCSLRWRRQSATKPPQIPKSRTKRTGTTTAAMSWEWTSVREASLVPSGERARLHQTCPTAGPLISSVRRLFKTGHPCRSNWGQCEHSLRLMGYIPSSSRSFWRLQKLSDYLNTDVNVNIFTVYCLLVPSFSQYRYSKGTFSVFVVYLLVQCYIMTDG